MTKLKDTEHYERLIMLAVQPVIKELLLVDVADLISYLNFDQHNMVADIVDSASEQYFAPGFVGYREVGTAEVDWDYSPSITLQMAINAPRHCFEFSLTLGSSAASVKLIEVSPFSVAIDRKVENALSSLERAISINSVKAA